MAKKHRWYYLDDAGDSVDSDYQSILDRSTTLGYTLPSASQQAKQNTFVADLKAAGIWTLLDVLYVFATDGDSDFATLNWKAPTSYKITKVNTPTFTTNEGFNGNGTNQYLNTNFVPSTNGVNLTLNSTSLATHLFNHVTETKYDCGTAPSFLASSPLLYFRGDDGYGSVVYTVNQAPNAVQSNGGNCSGFWMAQRKDASNVYMFKNGAQTDTDADASTAVPSGNMFLLAANSGGAPANPSTRKMSMFSLGASLAGLESAYHTSWNTYLTSL
jgi:hypothetical protein